MNGKAKKIFGWSFISFMLAFTYLPIIILIIFSFAPTTKAIGNWNNIEWSFALYGQLFENEQILDAIKNTFIIALVSSSLATIIGTVGAVGIHQLGKKMKTAVNGMSQITVINAEIVTGAAFMLFFAIIPFEMDGYPALITAHTIITMPYVLLSVMPRLTQLNPNLYEAGLDLGAGPLKTLVKVILPQLIPGMIAGFGLAFTLSLDDYVISKFINGGVQTISTLIYSATKKGIPAVWRAVSSLIFVVILAMLIVMNLAKSKSKKEDK